MSMTVPVNEPVITAASKRYVAEAMESGWISSAGKYIDQFERSFAQFLGVKHAVTTTSGTTAIHLALAVLGIGPGDEVIVSNFTMMGSVAPILLTGATPVFIDAEKDTYNMDVTQLRGKITKKTKAIMPVHIYGHSVDMDPVLALAKEFGIPVIEDAAEAHGATYKGKMCGSLGDLNCFSFYGNKIITTGEGGMVVTDNDELAALARQLKDLAHSPKKRFWHERLGFNYRMTNLQAACGLGQMEHVQEFLEKKRWMAKSYAERLSDIPGLRLPVTKPYAENVYWMYAILVEPPFPLGKDDFRKALKDRGIDTRDFFYSSAKQPVAAHLVPPGDTFPVTDYLADHGLYLPSGLALTEEQLGYVCDSIHAILA
jgi:perosamine synthetase